MNRLHASTAALPRTALVAAGVAASLALGACAGTAPPHEQMAVSTAAVERVSGPTGAEAPGEVSTARDKLARARRAMADKDYALADRLARQAEADAALAEARARATRADGALHEVRDGIRALRAELARS
ncbi:MAG: DUF4398 domain-containing protein [Rubrivivax sp.]